MSSLRFSSVSPSMIQPPKEGQFAVFLNSEDGDKAYVKDHLDNIKLFNNDDANFTDITLEAVEPFILGTPVGFVKTDYGSEIDVIEIGQTEITRGVSQSIFNIAVEPNYQVGSPTNTEWNSQYTDPSNNGFGDLSDVGARTYGNFVDALNGSVGNYVLSTPLVMHDLSTDKYYAFTFTGWTMDAAGGGFAYTRQEITIPQKYSLTFSDGTSIDTAPVMDIESSSLEIGVVESVVDGKRIKTLSFVGGSGAINYSNVLFVDGINGNDTTALAGRFDKPYLNIFSALSMAATMGASSTDKVLIYVRRGRYSWSGYLQDYVDLYCETGVVFISGRIQDGSGAVNANIFGNAILINTDFYIGNASTVNFEFDYISNKQSAGSIMPASGKATVNIKANLIYAVGNGTGYAFTIRNDADVTMDIKRAIMSPHQALSFRFYTGKCIINCPSIQIVSGNIYGGSFKHAVVIYDSMSGYIEINGSLINADQSYYGGISAMLTTWGGAPLSGKFVLNGDILSTLTRPINGAVGGGGSITINGNIYSDSFAIWCYGNGKFLFKNGIIKTNLTATEGYLMAINDTAEVYIKDCYLYNSVIDTSLVVLNSTTCQLVLDGCQGVSEGAAGFSVTTTVASGLLYVNNSRFNKIINPPLVDLYSPSGLVIDINTKVPKF